MVALAVLLLSLVLMHSFGHFGGHDPGISRPVTAAVTGDTGHSAARGANGMDPTRFPDAVLRIPPFGAAPQLANDWPGTGSHPVTVLACVAVLTLIGFAGYLRLPGFFVTRWSIASVRSADGFTAGRSPRPPPWHVPSFSELSILRI